MDGETLLYSDETMTMLHLNESAAAVWRLCDGTRSVGEIVAFLQAAYPGASSAIEADVCEIIGEFSGQDVLRLD